MIDMHTKSITVCGLFSGAFLEEWDRDMTLRCWVNEVAGMVLTDRMALSYLSGDYYMDPLNDALLSDCKWAYYD